MASAAASVTATDWTVIVAAVGVLLSLVGSAAIVSYRVGKIEQELRSATSANAQGTTTALQTMSERLARIEGMFELRLRTPPDGGG